MACTNVGAAAKTSPRRIRSTEQTLKALELRKTGMHYRKIAAEIGVKGGGTAYRYVASELAKIAEQCREEAGEVLCLELQRLDDLYLKAWREVEAGNVAAIDRCLRIMERRAKYLGLDAPEKSEITGKDGGPLEVHAMSDEEIERRAREILAKRYGNTE